MVVGTHVVTWAPYTALAVTEAALGPERANLIPGWASVSTKHFPLIFHTPNFFLALCILQYITRLHSVNYGH